MALIPRFYIDSIVAIGEKRMCDGKIEKQWFGTGFLVGLKEKEEGMYSVYVITNRHVLAEKEQIVIRFNMNDNTIKDYDVMLYENTGKSLFSCYPDPSIDVAAISINAHFLDAEKSKYSFFKLESDIFTIADMKEEGITEGDLIYTLGFPLGKVGNKYKSPFCRLGCISRIDDLYDGKEDDQNYIIDCQSFPGNSGGPVLSRPEAASLTGTKANTSAKLIGILHSYIPYREQFVSVQTGRVNHIYEENSGLTMVHPTDYIVETVKLEKERVNNCILKRIAEINMKKIEAAQQEAIIKTNSTNKATSTRKKATPTRRKTTSTRKKAASTRKKVISAIKNT